MSSFPYSNVLKRSKDIDIESYAASIWRDSRSHLRFLDGVSEKSELKSGATINLFESITASDDAVREEMFDFRPSLHAATIASNDTCFEASKPCHMLLPTESPSQHVATIACNIAFAEAGEP